MKLATLKSDRRDGVLAVVSTDMTRMAEASEIAPTLQAAIETWDATAPKLTQFARRVERSEIATQAYDPDLLASPLPRSYQWADGSAYLSHMALVRKARGAELPPNAETDPLLYQGGGDRFLAPTQDIPCFDAEWGLDFESEIAVITDDVPQGVSVEKAADHIRLIMLCNDVSLRHVMRPELLKGFGFYQSKPASSFSPVCVTPEELGAAWDGGKINLPLVTTYNGEVFGRVEAGRDLAFPFPELIAYAAKTRDLAAGTIIGSGTVSNRNHKEVGSSCLAEKRMIEIIETGEATTRFMEPGDTIRIEMLGTDGVSVFGAIDQRVSAS